MFFRVTYHTNQNPCDSENVPGMIDGRAIAMQTYQARATQVALDSSIAVTVLLSADNLDIQFWQLRPHRIADTSPEEFAARNLRAVGVVGLDGLTPRCAFKESLGSEIVNAIAVGFVEYIRASVCDGFNEQSKLAEIEELERVFSLPDTRT